MTDPASLLKVFKASPVPGILMLPDAPAFSIVEVTDSLLEICNKEAPDLLDKGFFKAFYGDMNIEDPDGETKIRESFRIVIDEKISNQGTSGPYRFKNTPILSDSGDLVYIFHCLLERRVRTPSDRRETLDKIAESSLDVICSIDAEGCFQTVNTAAERLWGYPADFLQGKFFMDFVYAPDSEETRLTGREVREGKNLRFFENRIICKDGNHMAMIWSAKWDHEDKLFYCIGKDATEKKKTELEMQLMIDNTDESFILLDKSLMITAYNLRFFRLYKEYFGREIKKNASILDYSITDDQSHLLEIYRSVLEGETKSSEITLPFPRNTPKVFLLNYKPAKNNKNEVVGVFITVKDVTEATLAKQKVEASEEKYRLLFYNSPKAMWIYDLATFRILDVNDTAVQNYGYSHEEFCNRTIWELKANKDVRKIIAYQQETQKKEGRIYFGKDLHRKKDGTHLTVELFGYKVNFDQKECVVVVSSDITEKEKILRQLKDNEAKLLTAQKIAKIGYWQLQLEGKEFYWSDEIYNIWGVSKDTFDLNRDSLKTIHPEDIDLFYKQKEELLNGRGWVDFEHRIILPDGSVKWVHEKGEIIKNGSGVPVIIEGTVQDITDAKLLELSLEESSQRYKYVTKATSDAIWDWNLMTDDVFWGEGIYTIFGYNTSDVQPGSSSWRNNIHPDDSKRIKKEINAVINGSESFWTNEYRFKRADGSYAFVLDRAFVIRTDTGKAIRMVGSLQDISRQKEEENRLKLLESVITNTSDGVLILEAATESQVFPKVIYANQAFCNMIRFSAEELLGKPLEFLELSDSTPADTDAFLEKFRKEETFERTAKVNTKDGEVLWINTIYNPVTHTPGDHFQWVAINRNVTQRKNEESKKTLFTDISEIFKGPLTLNDTLHQILTKVKSYGDFGLAEIWLTGSDRNQINLSAWLTPTEEAKIFYEETADQRNFLLGEGLPGTSWEREKVEFWNKSSNKKSFLRKEAIAHLGVDSVLAFPLIYNEEFIGVLMLGYKHSAGKKEQYKELFEGLSSHLSAEIKRKQLAQELNQIFEFSPDIICVAGSKGYYKKVNPAMSRILEYSEAELLSIPMENFVHADDRVRTLKSFEGLALGKDTDYIENRLISKTGKVFWLAWTATAGTEEGTYFCIAKDITEKKNLEHLLNEANRLARIGSWEFNVKEQKLFWSDITKEIHEYDENFTPDPTQTTEHCKPGKNREIFEKTVAQAVNTGTGWDLEIEIITANGREKWVRTIGEVEYLNGEPYRIYGSMQDIDARKRAEEELQKSNELYSIVSKTINDSIWEWDAVSNEITRPGKKLEPLLGYEDVVPPEVARFFHNRILPADKERMFARLSEFLKDPAKVYWEEEYRLLKADGTYASIYDRGYVMRDEMGKAIRMIGSSQDISKLKENEIQLKNLNEALQKHVKDLAVSNAELEQFAYIASHDLQEPLRMVTSFLSQIEKKYGDILDERGKQYIFYAVDGAKRMRQIILDLLEFSRVGRSDDDLEPIDVNELLEEVSILYSKQITENHAQLKWVQLPVVESFKSPLRQIFLNLIGNALKYQKSEIAPVVEIGFEEHDQYWLFWVSDNGIGIDPEYFDRIFVIFQRLHNKDEYSGTGIGLAIVKKIVENWGGKIWVESEEGKGSTFYFTINK